MQKNILTLRLSKSNGKNTHSFYCQDLFLGNGYRMANEDNDFFFKFQMISIGH